MIIGVLAVIAVPSFLKARKEARISRYVNDLRQITSALDQIAMAQGDYPPDRTPRLPPAGISNYLTRLSWTDETPVGGYWDWDFLQYGFGGRAGVSV